ncbi:hypothetical protein MCOR27_007866 [Pyricularia oryzae]|uniref:Uncharacterized protein n=2 Tax=Pyricularia TaxID=48558 RepID=A0ABQ8NQ56_PYRGI|nr:hypothetical protein MCOR01_011478 [Pyricularia oryzae]KAI6300473.1 hypothetical protein MCOR33_003878 [Pyricularia grisea]KAI6262645.1 hypothetical protein MCOR19_001153 [Pyricularia oryzae]KAI6273394.1 hypothetical protein MCOR27_007866 [Pyricularia oryzae]KAI6277212.1 hypothetical protein MCOR26_005285 [Pyricularia oryzae]
MSSQASSSKTSAGQAKASSNRKRKAKTTSQSGRPSKRPVNQASLDQSMSSSSTGDPALRMQQYDYHIEDDDEDEDDEEEDEELQNRGHFPPEIMPIVLGISRALEQAARQNRAWRRQQDLIEEVADEVFYMYKLPEGQRPKGSFLDVVDMVAETEDDCRIWKALPNAAAKKDHLERLLGFS